MENTFENAFSYISSLVNIDVNFIYDNRALATALVSYSAKTNKDIKTIDHLSLLKAAIKSFRQWQLEWDDYDKKKITTKPITAQALIEKLNSDFINGKLSD